MGVQVYILPLDRDWCVTDILQDWPNYYTTLEQKASTSPTVCGYEELLVPVLISREKKKKGANSHMQKRCVIQETRKTKHNLVSLHPVPERIWTARPTTLGLLLSSLMWPCASCVPGCAGSQLQHLPSTLPDGCWLCCSAGKLELRA